MFFKKKHKHIDNELIDMTKIPTHIAIIMDGNGRWAKKRSLPRSVGHKAGSDNLKKVCRVCDKIGVKHLTVYAFSTENWARPKSEVDILMSLLLNYLKNAEKELDGDKIRIDVIGFREGLPLDIQNEIKRVEQLTSENQGLKLHIALNYGGRNELTMVCKKLARDVKSGNLKPDDINEEDITQRLFTSHIPDPDLLIRTSGEMRISNFLLWQLAYAEFWYTDTLWPDFGKKDVYDAIIAFQKRDRRFGGV